MSPSGHICTSVSLKLPTHPRGPVPDQKGGGEKKQEVPQFDPSFLLVAYHSPPRLYQPFPKNLQTQIESLHFTDVEFPCNLSFRGAQALERTPGHVPHGLGKVHADTAHLQKAKEDLKDGGGVLCVFLDLWSPCILISLLSITVTFIRDCSLHFRTGDALTQMETPEMLMLQYLSALRNRERPELEGRHTDRIMKSSAFAEPSLSFSALTGPRVFGLTLTTPSAQAPPEEGAETREERRPPRGPAAPRLRPGLSDPEALPP